jgi:uncharacterized protein YecT (DUF1311 family)
VRCVQTVVFACVLVAIWGTIQNSAETGPRDTFSSTQPQAPTAKDLEDCKAVVDSEGHGPDPGSTEWWAACERLRARRVVPSFDCSKASGQVEELICSDPELAALDIELARLYRAVAGQTSGQKLQALRTYQRGWIKGRNACWKAVEVSVRACVEASYQDRIRQLTPQR